MALPHRIERSVLGAIFVVTMMSTSSAQTMPMFATPLIPHDECDSHSISEPSIATNQQTDSPPVRPSRISIDAFGEYRYSRFNFTDLRYPYDSIDGYLVLRLQGWFDSRRRLAGYINLIPAIATADEFFFQRYVEIDY